MMGHVGGWMGPAVWIWTVFGVVVLVLLTVVVFALKLKKQQDQISVKK